MKFIWTKILISLAFVGIAVGASAADFEKGLEAYQHGRFEAAAREWKPLAEKGDARALYYLGTMYGDGKGVAQNEKQSVKLIRLSAERGYVLAQYLLGLLYYYEIGDPKDGGIAKDGKKSEKWSRLAGEQGYAEAQFWLAKMYRYGYGVAIDANEAAKWYRLAAEQGHPNAQLGMWKMYSEGIAVSKDKVKAQMWVNLARANGIGLKDDLRDEWMKQLTAADITQAKQLAEECLEKNYKGC